MNEHNAQNGAKKGTRTNRARPYVAMVSVLDLADGDKPELVERLAGLAGDDGHEHGGRLVGHVVQGDLAGGAGAGAVFTAGAAGAAAGAAAGSADFLRLMIAPAIFVTYIRRIRPKKTTAMPSTTIKAAVPMETSSIAAFTRNMFLPPHKAPARSDFRGYYTAGGR